MDAAEAHALLARLEAELRAVDAALYLDRPGRTRSDGDRAREIRALQIRALRGQG
jgi:hypothetical protein